MKTKRKSKANDLLCWFFGTVLLVILIPGIVIAAESLDPDADRILMEMSAYLGKTQAFSLTADIDNEILTQEGQKLQISSVATMTLRRPDKFNAHRKGMFADARFVFDGKTLTLYGQNLNVYCQLPLVGTIDDAIREMEIGTGLNAPGADLLFADPYAVLSPEVMSSTYLGIAYVDGIPCHHLAFRNAQVDWQLWVREGNTPLPMKYVITSKWQTAAPQYEVRMRDWNTHPDIKPDQFSFKAPDGAKKVDNIPVNDLGEMILEEEVKK